MKKVIVFAKKYALDIITKPFRFRYYKNADNGVQNSEWRPIKAIVESKSDLFCLSFLTPCHWKRAQSEPSSYFLFSVLPICQSLCAFQDSEATEGKKQLDPRNPPASGSASGIFYSSQLFPLACPTSTRYCSAKLLVKAMKPVIILDPGIFHLSFVFWANFPTAWLAR